jgi:ElaB/YqjD/DUF883 family membrane-anchored ribosome-binding protein
MTTKSHTKHTGDNSGSMSGEVMSMVHAGTERLSDVAEAVGEKYEQLAEGVMDRIESAGETAKQMKKGVERRVRQQPLKSMLIIAGVGFVLGALWRGR